MKLSRRQAMRMAKQLLKNDLAFHTVRINNKAKAMSDECDDLEVMALIVSVLNDAIAMHTPRPSMQREFNKYVKNFDCF